MLVAKTLHLVSFFFNVHLNVYVYIITLDARPLLADLRALLSCRPPLSEILDTCLIMCMVFHIKVCC